LAYFATQILTWTCYTDSVSLWFLTNLSWSWFLWLLPFSILLVSLYNFIIYSVAFLGTVVLHAELGIMRGSFQRNWFDTYSVMEFTTTNSSLELLLCHSNHQTFRLYAYSKPYPEDPFAALDQFVNSKYYWLKPMTFCEITAKSLVNDLINT
jgi:hypothetical protein